MEQSETADKKTDNNIDNSIDNNSRQEKKISIRTKLILIISGFLVFTMAAIIFVSSYLFRQDNEVRLKENNLKLAEVIALKIKADLNAMISKSRFIANTLYEERNQRNKPNSLRLFSSEEKDLLFISIVRRQPDGSFRSLAELSSDRFPGKEDNTDQYLKRYKQKLDRSFADSVEVFNATPDFPDPLAGICLPFTGEGRASGTYSLLLFVSMEPFLEAVQSPGMTKSFAVNGQGKILFHYNPSFLKTEADYQNLPIVREMLKSTIDNRHLPYKDEEGKSFYGAFKKIDTGGIGVISSVAEEKAFAAVTMVVRRNLLIGFILLNIVIIIVSIYSRTFTRPIKSLAEGARQIEAGNYNISIEATTRDEIGELTQAFTQMGRGLAEREKLKDAFGKFVNKDLAEQALHGEIKLGGERTSASIFFSDIRSFTSISEGLQPEEVVEFLNQYMTLMVACVNKTNGMVDKFIGDAIMAVWGAPVSYGNDTENAVNAALMMRRVLYKFNEDRGGPKKPVIRIGCGINTGPVLAGQIGSQDKMEYTVIGDAVNLASRIEALNKPFGTDVLITEDAYKLVRDIYHVEAMKKINVKGKKEPQQIYAVLSRKDNPKGIQSLDKLQKILGVDPTTLTDFNPDEEHEQKYEIIE